MHNFIFTSRNKTKYSVSPVQKEFQSAFQPIKFWDGQGKKSCLGALNLKRKRKNTKKSFRFNVIPHLTLTCRSPGICVDSQHTLSFFHFNVRPCPNMKKTWHVPFLFVVNLL